ncbi:MAG TPA: hypothetical protein VJN92_01840 [Candidatus Acidoferrum sp.]|nr:hypothetical protein [Candidatus Acidoferrum sp.]
MFESELYRKLSLMAAALSFLTAAACSNQPAKEADQRSTQAPGQATSSAAPSAATVSPTGNPATNPADATQPLHLVTLPKGTKITASVGQTLASDKNHWGDSFAASLARPVKVDGKTVLPRGTEVTGRILEVKSHELKVVLASVVVDGVYCDLTTNSRRPSDKDKPKHSNRKQNKDNSTLSARTRLTFKLSKPATIPAKA